jgi:hypothetical protein
MELETHKNGAVQTEPKAVTFTLLRADRDAVRKFWSKLIRPGLLRIKAKDKRSGEWQPEHVRQRIEAGFNNQILCECYLIIQSNSPNPVGFTITQAFPDEFIGVPLYLHNWITWCEKAPLRKVLPYVLPELERHATEDLGLRGVQGITSRLQWLRRCTKYGYHIHQVIIRKTL